MVLSKVLFSIELLALVGVLFFLPATFLVEQNGDVNGRSSRFRGGVFLCVIIYALSVLLRVVQTGTIKMPQRDLGYETIYLVSGGISSLASILFGVAIFCIYKLQKKTNTGRANHKWLHFSLWFLGASMLLFGIGLVLSNL